MRLTSGDETFTVGEATVDRLLEPPADLCHRLREHTRPWPMWTTWAGGLPDTDDPWADLLAGSARARPS